MIEYRNITHAKELWEIFYQECTGHTKALRDLLIRLPETSFTIEDTDLKRLLSTRLHRLKGSLGFLGFKEYAEVVKKIEDDLKRTGTGSAKEIQYISDELEIMTKELEVLIRT